MLTRDLRGARLEAPVLLEDCHFETPWLGEEAVFLGPVTLIRCTGAGLEFSNARFAQAVRLKRCSFEGSVVLRGARFSGEVRLDGSRLGGLELDDAELEMGFELEDCAVSGRTCLRGAVFGGWADFSGSRLGSSTFERCRFASGAEFRETRFEGPATFCQATVERDAIFRDAVFVKGVDFARLRVGGSLDLVRARVARRLRMGRCSCAQDLWMQESQLRCDAELEGLRVLGELALDGARLEGTLGLQEAAVGTRLGLARIFCARDFDFTRVAVGQLVDLREAQVQRLGLVDLVAAEVSLVGARVREAVLTDARVGRLDLDPCQVDNLLDCRGLQLGEELACLETRAEQWRLELEDIAGRVAGSRRGHPVRGVREWTLLARYFQGESRYDDMDEAALEARRMARALKPFYWAWLEWLLVDLSCGYGLRPFRVLGTSVVVILAFAVFFFVYEPGDVRQSLLASLLSFLSPDRAADHAWLEAAVSESVLGLFLTALFIGTLTRKLAR